ncbi:MAG: phosphoribosyl-AMP cyclohydrolase [Proteobacteria bacterium]|nr:phosphoribosyl-AMP cyclohydrolase [Pseudomonadota bacterium]
MTSTSQTTLPLVSGETEETTRSFRPAFGPDGLIPAIVTDSASGDVLMFAYMNEEAMRETIASGLAHFWSRSRAKLWKKGDESGNLLKVIQLRTDCDQDVIWVVAEVQGDGVACHTGERSCFYRRVVQPTGGGAPVLEFAPLPGSEKQV